MHIKQTVNFAPVFCRSSCKVISTQALQYGHMLTPEAGNTQWMEEHEEEACGLLRKPLGLGSFNIPRVVVEIFLFQTFKSVLMPHSLHYFLLRAKFTFSLFDDPYLIFRYQKKVQ